MAEPYVADNSVLNLTFLVNGEDKGLHTLFKEGWVKFELNKISLSKFTFMAINPAVDQGEEDAIAVLQQKPDEDAPVLEVFIKDQNKNKLLFKGVVKSFHKQITPHQTVVKIECKDIAHELTKPTGDMNAGNSFEDVIIGYTDNYSIKLEGLDTVKGKEEIVLQHPNTVPWDYLVGYLDNLGYPVAVENGTMKIADIAEENGAKYVAEQGINVFNYSVKTEPQRRKSKVSISSWDVENQKVATIEVEQQAPENEDNLQLNNSALHASTLERVAQAKLKRSNVASIYGEVLTFGNLEAEIGDYIELRKIQEDVDKKPLLISRAIHQIESGNWKTEFAFGLEDERSFLESLSGNGQNTQIKSGLTNSVQGLQIGVVVQIEDDPDNQFRIKIKLPMLAPNSEGVWARLAHLNASAGWGSFFIPDVGDEVIIGCLDNNPDSPVILGSLYNPQNTPSENIEADNDIKGFVTREGTKIILKESEKSILLTNASGDSITVSDDLKGIKIEDQNGNAVQMDNSGISLKSQTALKIESNDSLKISSSAGVKIETSGIMELKGSMIKLN